MGIKIDCQQVIDQLGGAGRLKAMVGAHSFVNHGDALSFKFKAGTKANYIKITLTPRDEYDVEISKVSCGPKRGLQVKVIDRTEGAYCDMLVSLFENATGLYLSL